MRCPSREGSTHGCDQAACPVVRLADRFVASDVVQDEARDLRERGSWEQHAREDRADERDRQARRFFPPTVSGRGRGTSGRAGRASCDVASQ